MANIASRVGLFAIAAVSLLTAAPTDAAEFMFRASVDGRVLEGKPLSWDADHMLLLARDGQLHQFTPKLAQGAVKTSPQFVGYSPVEMKARLEQEFDNR